MTIYWILSIRKSALNIRYCSLLYRQTKSIYPLAWFDTFQYHIFRTNTHHVLSMLLHSISITLALAIVTSTSAQSNSKRGVSVLGDDHNSDWSLLTSGESPLSWYWNWSPWPTNSALVSDLNFIPQIHGIGNLIADVAQAKTIPKNSTHLMAFNEPDGTTDSGGSSISPEDAAKAYIEHIRPLRKSEGGRFLVSHPATTGSSSGLDWLRGFNSSCYDLNPSDGCPLDFITAHWYGDFDGLVSWLGQLDEFYNDNSSTSSQTPLKIWITELALPQQDEETTLQMMNQTLLYLDKLDIVERYAWFGMFRRDESNEWTGKEVALFQNDGGLTKLGATYLNGAGGTVTFREGQKGTAEENSVCNRQVERYTWVILGVVWVLII